MRKYILLWTLGIMCADDASAAMTPQQQEQWGEVLKNEERLGTREFEGIKIHHATPLIHDWTETLEAVFPHICPNALQTSEVARTTLLDAARMYDVKRSRGEVIREEYYLKRIKKCLELPDEDLKNVTDKLLCMSIAVTPKEDLLEFVSFCERKSPHPTIFIFFTWTVGLLRKIVRHSEPQCIEFLLADFA